VGKAGDEGSVTSFNFRRHCKVGKSLGKAEYLSAPSTTYHVDSVEISYLFDAVDLFSRHGSLY
jgi:hypothetical protein